MSVTNDMLYLFNTEHVSCQVPFSRYQRTGMFRGLEQM
jgi:hypothetical protein